MRLCDVSSWPAILLCLAVFPRPLAVPAQDKQPPQPSPPLVVEEPPAPRPNDTPEQKLLKMRLNAAHSELGSRFREYWAGRGTHDVLLESIDRVAKSKIELADGKAGVIRVLEQKLDLLKHVEALDRLRFNQGRMPRKELDHTQYVICDTELELLRLKKAMK